MGDLMATPEQTSMKFSDSLDTGDRQEERPPSRQGDPTEPRPTRAPRLGTGAQLKGVGFNNQADLDQSKAAEREAGVDQACMLAADHSSLSGIGDTSSSPLGSSCRCLQIATKAVSTAAIFIIHKLHGSVADAVKHHFNSLQGQNRL